MIDLKTIKKHDTVFLNRIGGPQVGTVLFVNHSRQTVLVAYRRSAFGASTEHRGYFKPEDIDEVRPSLIHES